MRTPLSWLRDFAPFEGDVGVLTENLDDLGLIVEGVERVGEGLHDIVVSRVVDIASIPGADKIRRVTADTGVGTVEVVCGAWNFSVGDLVPFVPAGATLPGGTVITRRKMRGVISQGMLCSGSELGLSDDQSGLLVLTDVEGARPGVPIVEALGIEPDVVFDITVEGNRPDAWSMSGVARDLAARMRLPFMLPEPAVPAPLGPAVGELASLVVEDRDLCPRFTVCVLRGVAIGPSPRWMARRLMLAGMRPINNVVDASNYVMLELGQPSHPYDLARLNGSGLLVRRALAGETVVTLDGVTRTLGQRGRGLGDTGEDCVICDAEGGVVGIAGIMGGASSEISEHTRDVLLETAYFTPIAIARTSKRLGLRTEASARFERGCDPWGIDRAASRFCELLAPALGGGALAVGALDVRGEVPEPVVLRVPMSRVNQMLGTDLDAGGVADLLEPIGFGCDADDGSQHVTVTVPTNRPDVREGQHGVVDVIEEIARSYGYSRLPRRQPSWPEPGRLSAYQRERRRMREVLCGIGAEEVWTPTLVSDDDHQKVGLAGLAVSVTNPLASDESVLRRSLLPGLLRALAYNTERRQGAIRLFEVGTVFSHPDAGEGRKERSGAGGREEAVLPGEREMLAAVFAAEGDDARPALAAWHVVVDALRITGARIATPDVGEHPAPGLHPTRWARLVETATKTVVGTVGEVDPDTLARFGLSVSQRDAAGRPARRVGWMELDLGLVLAGGVVPRRPEVSHPVSRFPSSDIDLAFVVNDVVPTDAVAAALRTAGGDALESVTLFDVYRGESLGEGRRSLAYRLRFCAEDHTLTDEEVGRLRQACIDAAAGELGAVLR